MSKQLDRINEVIDTLPIENREAARAYLLGYFATSVPMNVVDNGTARAVEYYSAGGVFDANR